MKYRFICAIYFLGMEKDNMTIPLPSGKISNEKGLLKQMFDNNLSVGTLGIHSIEEFMMHHPTMLWTANLLMPLQKKTVMLMEHR